MVHCCFHSCPCQFRSRQAGFGALSKLALLPYSKVGSFGDLSGSMDMSEKMLMLFQGTASVIPEQYGASLPGMQTHSLLHLPRTRASGLVFGLHLGPAPSCWQFGNLIACAVAAHLLSAAAERVTGKHLIFDKYSSVINASYLNDTFILIAKCWIKVPCVFLTRLTACLSL